VTIISHHIISLSFHQHQIRWRSYHIISYHYRSTSIRLV